MPATPARLSPATKVTPGVISCRDPCQSPAMAPSPVPPSSSGSFHVLSSSTSRCLTPRVKLHIFSKSHVPYVTNVSPLLYRAQCYHVTSHKASTMIAALSVVPSGTLGGSCVGGDILAFAISFRYQAPLHKSTFSRSGAFKQADSLACHAV